MRSNVFYIYHYTLSLSDFKCSRIIIIIEERERRERLEEIGLSFLGHKDPFNQQLGKLDLSAVAAFSYYAAVGYILTQVYVSIIAGVFSGPCSYSTSWLNESYKSSSTKPGKVPQFHLNLLSLSSCNFNLENCQNQTTPLSIL